jgi:ribosome-binding factor A
MPKHRAKARQARSGPTQRQLRAGELVRHALVDILRHERVADEAVSAASVTLSEVRMSPDLKHAVCFVEPLGGTNAGAVVAGLNRAAKFLRGKLGRVIELRFTPTLRFVHDDSFDAAAHMSRLLAEPKVRRDILAADGQEEG